MFKIHHMNEKQLPSYPLRMPPEVREQVEAAAKASGRSMNAEIIARLQSSFDAPSQAAQTDEEIEGLRRLASLTYQLQRAALNVDMFRNRLTIGWHDAQEAMKSGPPEAASKAKAAYVELHEEMQRRVAEIGEIEQKIHEIHLARKVAGFEELRDVEPIYASVRGATSVDTGVVVHDAGSKKKLSK